MKRKLLLISVSKTLCNRLLLTPALMFVCLGVFAQDAFIGYDYNTTSVINAWATPKTINSGGAKELIITVSDASRIKTNTTAGTSSILGVDMGSNSYYIEGSLTANSENDFIGAIAFTGSTNSGDNTGIAGVLYSDKIPFDDTSIIGASETTAFPISSGPWSNVVANSVPAGAKSFRFYRKTPTYNSATYGGGTTIRLASIAVTFLSTLPISLTSFKASAKTDGINLHWTTSSENNADKFVIERKSATTGFANLIEVKAKEKAGNYTITDKNVANGETYYYRLKMVDKDGSYIYSNISSATFNLETAKSVSVYPNPATNSVTVSYPETGNTVSNLTITDTKGAVLITSVIPANSSQKSLDVSALKTGIYIININTNEGRKTLKLVKH